MSSLGLGHFTLILVIILIMIVIIISWAYNLQCWAWVREREKMIRRLLNRRLEVTTAAAYSAAYRGTVPDIICGIKFNTVVYYLNRGSRLSARISYHGAELTPSIIKSIIFIKTSCKIALDIWSKKIAT